MAKENLNTEKRGQGINPAVFKRENFTQFQTWLSETKSVEGCPVDCKYCFFQLDGQTPIKPKINISPEETLKLLGESYTYQKDMPVHFGSQTDAFSTKKNVQYYTKLLLEYGKSNYNNPLVFITKKEIPDEFIQTVKQIRQKVIFYISYSGLSNTDMEPNVNTEDLIKNFIKLKEANIARVHYWRPFLPYNSNKNKIDEILGVVNKYATCSVISGLRLNSGIRDNLIKFWPELSMLEFDFKKTGEIWPQGVRGYIKKYISEKYPNYPLFMGNTPCSLTYAMETSDISGLYKSRMCLDSLCQETQELRCKNGFKKPSINEINRAVGKMEIDQKKVFLKEDKIIIEGNVEIGKIVYLKTILKFPILTAGDFLYENGYNWANVSDENQIIEIPWKDNWTQIGGMEGRF